MLTGSIDYEGPAFEHLHQFLHFSAQIIRDLLPAVQQRLGLQDPFHVIVSFDFSKIYSRKRDNAISDIFQAH